MINHKDFPYMCIIENDFFEIIIFVFDKSLVYNINLLFLYSS